MLKTLAPFLLIPFLVSDLTDNQWPHAVWPADPVTALLDHPTMLPIALKYRAAAEREIQTLPPAVPTDDRADAYPHPCSLFCPPQAAALPGGDTLYQFMSLLI
jgi:hypothetical protein